MSSTIRSIAHAAGVVDPAAQWELRWEALTSDDLDAIAALLARPGGRPIHLSPSEAARFKRLPICETLSGRRVALASGEFFTLSALGLLDPETGIPLPPSARDSFLVPTPVLQDMCVRLGFVLLLCPFDAGGQSFIMWCGACRVGG